MKMEDKAIHQQNGCKLNVRVRKAGTPLYYSNPKTQARMPVLHGCQPKK